jgi:hypothetical protein
MEKPPVMDAIEIRIGLPRLSGKLFYAPPSRWWIDVQEDSLSIVVNDREMRNLGWFFIVLAIAVFPCAYFLFWHYSDSIPHASWPVMFAACCPSLGLVIAAVCVRWSIIRESRRGPLFHYSRVKGQFQFPRLQHSFDSVQVVRWELVFGSWVRSDDGSARQFGEGISELQLVFRWHETLFALPVIGGVGPAVLNSSADLIAKATSRPLEHITESRRMCNPFKESANEMNRPR